MAEGRVSPPNGDLWPAFKARVQASHQALSRQIARELADGLVADDQSELPNAVACFMDDVEACIAHLRLPIGHRRGTRTTNLLERLFVEGRRRLKINPNAFGEKAVLKLMFGAMIRAAERCRALAGHQGDRVRAPSDGGSQEGTRSGIRGRNRPRCKDVKGSMPTRQIPSTART